jgi:hypothetical protein
MMNAGRTGRRWRSVCTFPALQENSNLKEQGLTVERVTFNFMKRCIQPLMKRDHLGYEYTRVDDNSRLKAEEINDDLIMEWLGKIFKDLKPEVPATAREYSANRPPKLVSICDHWWTFCRKKSSYTCQCPLRPGRKPSA